MDILALCPRSQQTKCCKRGRGNCKELLLYHLELFIDYHPKLLPPRVIFIADIFPYIAVTINYHVYVSLSQYHHIKSDFTGGGGGGYHSCSIC